MKIIGHRGARGLAPENTIASLQKGLEHHVDEIEFDLRVTKDHIVVLHHDTALKDASGQKLVIANCDFDELKQHKPDLTTFREAMEFIGAKTTAYIEVKPGELVKPIVEILEPFAGDSSLLLLGSKSQKTLCELHAALPNIPKIVIEPWSGIRATYHARQVGTKYISMNQLWLWPGFINHMNRSGYKLYAYTINDITKAKRWEKAGLYGIVTDYPDLFQF